jgi:translation initiation factor 2 subunit 1
MSNKSRFYEKTLPNVNEIVMVKIKAITDIGVNVVLLEYNNLEGLMLLGELSRKRIRSIHKLVRIGVTEPVMVIRIDPIQKYVDLSKKRITADDIATCTDRYHKAKLVDGILRRVAETFDYPLETLYAQVAWPLDKHYGTSYIGFRGVLTSPDEITAKWDPNLPLDIKQSLIQTICHRMASQSIKVCACIDITCYEHGINAIKDSLRQGIVDKNIQINLVASPTYTITTTSIDEITGIDLIQQAIKAITTCIEGYGGTIYIRQPPQGMGDHEKTWIEQARDIISSDYDESDN